MLLAVALITVLVTTVLAAISVKANVMTTAIKSVVGWDGAGTDVGMMRKSVSMNVTWIAPETVETMAATTEF